MGWGRFVSYSKNTIDVLCSAVRNRVRAAVSWPASKVTVAAARSICPAWEATPSTNPDIFSAGRWHLSDSEGVKHGPNPFSQR